MTVNIGFFVLIRQPGVEHSEPVARLASLHEEPFGYDITYALSPLSRSVPYIVQVRSSNQYEANTDVQILVGCYVWILSNINDMETHVNALLAWHLKKMTVGVVPG